MIFVWKCTGILKYISYIKLEKVTVNLECVNIFYIGEKASFYPVKGKVSVLKI